MTKYYLLDKEGDRITDCMGLDYPAVSKEEAERYAVEEGYKEGEGEGEAYISVRAYNKEQGF